MSNQIRSKGVKAWKRVAVRAEIYDKLAELADKEHRSIANYLEHLLRKMLYDDVCKVKGE